MKDFNSPLDIDEVIEQFETCYKEQFGSYFIFPNFGAFLKIGLLWDQTSGNENPPLLQTLIMLATQYFNEELHPYSAQPVFNQFIQHYAKDYFDEITKNRWHGFNPYSQQNLLAFFPKAIEIISASQLLVFFQEFNLQQFLKHIDSVTLTGYILKSIDNGKFALIIPLLEAAGVLTNKQLIDIQRAVQSAFGLQTTKAPILAKIDLKIKENRLKALSVFGQSLSSLLEPAVFQRLIHDDAFQVDAMMQDPLPYFEALEKSHSSWQGAFVQLFDAANKYAKTENANSQPIAIQNILIVGNSAHRESAPWYPTGEFGQPELFGGNASASVSDQHVRLRDFISTLIKPIVDLHLSQHYQFDGTLKPQSVNSITRLITNEFMFFTIQPLAWNEFEALIEHCTANLPTNVHLILSSFAVLLPDSSKLLNITVHVQGGKEPIIHYIVKNKPSSSDPMYFTGMGVVEPKVTTAQSVDYLLANTHNRKTMVSSQNVILCLTPSGGGFYSIVDICLDHYLGIGKSNFEKAIREHTKNKGLLLPLQCSHVVVSNTVALVEKHCIGEVVQADPQYSASEINDKDLLNGVIYESIHQISFGTYLKKVIYAPTKCSLLPSAEQIDVQIHNHSVCASLKLSEKRKMGYFVGARAAISGAKETEQLGSDQADATKKRPSKEQTEGAQSGENDKPAHRGDVGKHKRRKDIL